MCNIIAADQFPMAQELYAMLNLKTHNSVAVVKNVCICKNLIAITILRIFSLLNERALRERRTDLDFI